MSADDGPTWSDIADWYDDLLAAGSGPHNTATRCLLELTPPLASQTVLDVACGQGLATRALASVGARRVVGIDSSTAMIANALRHTAPTDESIAYLVDDAQQLASVEAGTFDGATCQLGLMDIPDLDATLEAIGRALRPGGWFVFVIGHPSFLGADAQPTTTADGRPAVLASGYFDERFWRSSNPNGVRRAGNHHRTLSTYLNALISAGFGLEAVQEPAASDLLGDQQPLYREVPIFLGARARLLGPRHPPAAQRRS